MPDQDFVSNKITGEIELGESEPSLIADEFEGSFPSDPWNVEEESTKEELSEIPKEEVKTEESSPRWLQNLKTFFTGSGPKPQTELEVRLSKLEKEKAALTTESEEEKVRSSLRSELGEVAESLGLEEPEQKDKFIKAIERFVTTSAETLVKKKLDTLETKFKDERELKDQINSETMQVATHYNGRTAPLTSSMKPFVEYTLDRFKEQNLLANVSLFDVHRLAELAPFVNHIDTYPEAKSLNFQQVIVAAQGLYKEYYERASKLMPNHKFTGYEHLDQEFNNRLSGGTPVKKEGKVTSINRGRGNVEISSSMVTDDLNTGTKGEILGKRKIKTADEVVNSTLDELLANRG